MLIPDNLNLVKSKIVAAVARSGRHLREVELIAVSKTFPIESIREALNTGCNLFGENRVQELISKVPALPATTRWHLIGHLQSNKVRKVLPIVEAIHSVDSLDLARQIHRIGGEVDRHPSLFLEVNVSGEASKFGFEPEQLERDFEALLSLEGLHITGLMTVPPVGESPEDSRRYFVALRELRDRLQDRSGRSLPGLSMGMSSDYEVAIEEGSTHVRVGSAIFGGR
ncbi:MAG: YggS family pyridoxal phosphate-dependent enzyme [Verrucomicrobium sp.]